MPVQGSVAVVYGAAGAIGSAVASAFAARGARLFLAGRTDEHLSRAAAELRDLTAEPVSTHVLDAADPLAVEDFTREVISSAGRIDVVINAVGIPLVQGIPLLEMPLADLLDPLTAWPRTQFLTARAAARHMVRQQAGTILTLSASPARMSLAGVGGFAAACAAVEALTRTLAAELGPSGVRTVCLRPQRIAETLGDTPDLPMPVSEFRTFLESLTSSKTLPTLDDVARAAVFLADGGAEAMNGAVLNLSCGMSPD
ncbi:SDR family oxidoreductase [Arthrobacter sp. zg-Y1143]|uniref:SDR family NAD(P)-dependent oxidoreductase n=1 Tax=Arthrobacter sp. zg-Y1143 TaxID=3049065 RepID=UPI0024C3FCFE|nr:SDR family oxidoreductase [Arthrobacter sp. zg-Y1143]MDK1327330.1 SDR family oxidoreductase [Arthrobacter sp. zg-Y1143]